MVQTSPNAELAEDTMALKEKNTGMYPTCAVAAFELRDGVDIPDAIELAAMGVPAHRLWRLEGIVKVCDAGGDGELVICGRVISVFHVSPRRAKSWRMHQW
jgi:hypothetical protein